MYSFSRSVAYQCRPCVTTPILRYAWMQKTSWELGIFKKKSPVRGFSLKQFFDELCYLTTDFILTLQVKTIQVGHLGPGVNEVLDELLLRIRAGANLGQSAQYRVRAEHEVDARPGPLDRAGLAVGSFEHGLGVRGRLPLRAHIQQVDEEVIRQHARPVREYAMGGPVSVDVDRAQATDQHGQLGRGQRQQLRLVDQDRLGGRRKSGLRVGAEPIGSRFKDREKRGVGLPLRGVRAARRARH